MWISQKNENSQGTSSPEPQKKSGSQKTYYRVGLCFPKSLRLLSKRHFKQILGGGARLSGQAILFRHYAGKGPSRVGITVSGKYGNAIERNYFKRLIREVFRELHSQFPAGLQVHVSPKKPKIPLTKKLIETDFHLLLADLANKG